jgi:hypothetical protein
MHAETAPAYPPPHTTLHPPPSPSQAYTAGEVGRGGTESTFPFSLLSLCVCVCGCGCVVLTASQRASAATRASSAALPLALPMPPPPELTSTAGCTSRRMAAEVSHIHCCAAGSAGMATWPAVVTTNLAMRTARGMEQADFSHAGHVNKERAHRRPRSAPRRRRAPPTTGRERRLYACSRSSARG